MMMCPGALHQESNIAIGFTSTLSKYTLPQLHTRSTYVTNEELISSVVLYPIRISYV